MYLLLSGEGRSDIGECYPAHDRCDAEHFRPGAMAIFIDQLIENQLTIRYSTAIRSVSCQNLIWPQINYHLKAAKKRCRYEARKNAPKPNITMKMPEL
jgi:hypothetical protein